ncbi:hypothetical protein [Marinicellulosiphila megalodicopiae]|uniref:hypothetical protein n=1 Tax=Marinicellulosiphila megalodicopiae TaxID=2724896 RepID=UPI003BAFE7DD
MIGKCPNCKERLSFIEKTKFKNVDYKQECKRCGVTLYPCENNFMDGASIVSPIISTLLVFPFIMICGIVWGIILSIAAPIITIIIITTLFQNVTLTKLPEEFKTSEEIEKEQ